MQTDTPHDPSTSFVAAIIDWSVANRFFVMLGSLVLLVAGIIAVQKTPLDAIPDLTDTQVIIRTDWPGQAQVLRVDGGMVASDWAMQYLADLLEAPVDRPVVTETTALGAAWLAGLQSGLCPPPGDEADQGAWRRERRFIPVMDRADAAARHDRWTRAVQATMAF